MVGYQKKKITREIALSKIAEKEHERINKNCLNTLNKKRITFKVNKTYRLYFYLSTLFT